MNKIYVLMPIYLKLRPNSIAKTYLKLKQIRYTFIK